MAGLALRRQIRYAIRVAKALTSDSRLPRPLRWALRAALAIKVVPVPDFGIDELILLVVGALLVTVYRPVLKAILAEARVAARQPPPRQGTGGRTPTPVLVEPVHAGPPLPDAGDG